MLDICNKMSSSGGAEFRISAVIPTHQRNNELKRAVISVTNSEMLPLEIIVVDDTENNHARKTVTQLKSQCKVPLHYTQRRHKDRKQQRDY